MGSELDGRKERCTVPHRARSQVVLIRTQGRHRLPSLGRLFLLSFPWPPFSAFPHSIRSICWRRERAGENGLCCSSSLLRRVEGAYRHDPHEHISRLSIFREQTNPFGQGGGMTCKFQTWWWWARDELNWWWRGRFLLIPGKSMLVCMHACMLCMYCIYSGVP